MITAAEKNRRKPKNNEQAHRVEHDAVDLPSFSATLVTSITFFLSRLTAWDTREASFATSSLKLKLAVVLVISRPFVVFFSFVRSVLFFVSW